MVLEMICFHRYFFPTYENDNLLCTLDDDEDDDESGTGSAAEMTEVIAEDLPVQEALERRDELIHDLMNWGRGGFRVVEVVRFKNLYELLNWRAILDLNIVQNSYIKISMYGSQCCQPYDFRSKSYSFFFFFYSWLHFTPSPQRITIFWYLGKKLILKLHFDQYEIIFWWEWLHFCLESFHLLTDLLVCKISWNVWCKMLLVLPYSLDISVSDIDYYFWHKITLCVHQNYYFWRDKVGSTGDWYFVCNFI